MGGWVGACMHILGGHGTCTLRPNSTHVSSHSVPLMCVATAPTSRPLGLVLTTCPPSSPPPLLLLLLILILLLILPLLLLLLLLLLACCCCCLPAAAAATAAAAACLQLLTETFTAPEVSLRVASFTAWRSFMDCCSSMQLLLRKRHVLLNPIKYALQYSNSQTVKLAAVGSWARLMLLLLGQQQLLWVVDEGLTECDAAAPAAAALPKSSSSSTQPQQSGVCSEGLSQAAFDAMLQPMVETILGCPQAAAAAAAGGGAAGGGAAGNKSAGSSKGKAPKDSSCLDATPVMQFVLQQAMVYVAQTAAAPAAGAAAGAANASSRQLVSTKQQQQQQQDDKEPLLLHLLLCQLLRKAACASADALAVDSAAAAACTAAAAMDSSCTPQADGIRAGVRPSDACCTPRPITTSPPAAAAAAAVAATSRHPTPPPSTPGHARLAGVPGLWGSGFKQGLNWLQLTTPLTAGGHTPLPSTAAAGQQRAGQAWPSAAQGLVPPGQQADPVRVLRMLPGWLQLLMQALQLLMLLLQPEAPVATATAQGGAVDGGGGQKAAGGSSSNQQQLERVMSEWLPSWCGLMRVMGAALLLLEAQDQTRQPGSGTAAAAVVDGAVGGVIGGGAAACGGHVVSSSSSSAEQQRVKQQVVGALVQCCWGLQHTLEVRGRSSSRGGGGREGEWKNEEGRCREGGRRR